MYPISNEAKALFESNAAKVVRITGSTVRILPTDIAVYSGDTLVYQSGDSKHLKLYSGSSEIYDNQGTKTVILYSGDKPIFINDEAGMPIQLNITSSDVRQGDFSIDRYSCNGQMLEIGTAIASEFTLQLDNVEGQFDGVVFEGVELFVEIGISDPADSDAEIIWVPCGYFTCDHQPRRLNTLSITALDRMMRFDKKLTSSSLTLPKTVAALVAAGCTACNVPLGQSLSGLPNANYSITALPDIQNGLTWRDIIRWCAGLMGTNAWIDWNGELRFSWYNNDTGYVSTTDNRFSSDLYENPIIITGVKFTDTDEANTTYIAGTEDYAIDVSDNGFINADNADALLPIIYVAMNGFAYTPFSASAIAAPYLWPMDRVTFTDKNGKGHVSVLTNVNLSVNGSTDIAAVGESAEFYSYGKSSSFTAQQQATLRRLQRVVGSEITDAVESATAQITGAQGGYVRFMYDANGVMTEILIMNTPDIATATKVWRWNRGGFGYSSNGYQGPFTTAITQDGAIVANFITVGALNASLITTGTLLANIIKAGILSDESGKNFWNMETGEFSLAAATTVGGSTVDSIAQNKANSAVSAFDNSLNQQSVFNRLTNNGQTQGIYLRNGLLYINASYIGSGIIDGTVVQAKLLNIIDNNNNVIASFDTSICIGKSNEVHINIDYNSFDVYKNAINTIFSVGDLRDSNGRSRQVEHYTGDGSTRYFVIHSYRATIVSIKVNGSEVTEYSIVYRPYSTDLTLESAPENGADVRVEYTVSGSVFHYDLGIRNEDSFTGDYSVIEGDNTIASGKYSHAEGSNTVAGGYCSHAEGEGTSIDFTKESTGIYDSHGGCHAEGYQTRIQAKSGYIGIGHHVEGNQCLVMGSNGNHAEGYMTKVDGSFGCHAEGEGTIARGYSQHVSGRYNVEDTGGSYDGIYAEIIGNGTSDNNRSNARTLSKTGNEWIAGTLTQASDSRLKEESGEVPDLSNVRARRFKWNDKKGTHDDLDHIGYFAQDVEKIAPYLVQEDAMGYKSLDYIALLCAKVEYLERRVQQLENEVKRHDD